MVIDKYELTSIATKVANSFGIDAETAKDVLKDV